MSELICQAKLVGTGEQCHAQAKYLVTAPLDKGKLVCGMHARQWLPKGLRMLESLK